MHTIGRPLSGQSVQGSLCVPVLTGLPRRQMCADNSHLVSIYFTQAFVEEELLATHGARVPLTSIKLSTQKGTRQQPKKHLKPRKQRGLTGPS